MELQYAAAALARFTAVRAPEATSGFTVAPSCVSVNGRSAMDTTCVRVAPGLGATVNRHVPAPAPVPPDVVDAQAGRLSTTQPLPFGIVTLTDPPPPAVPKVCAVADSDGPLGAYG